MSTIRATNFQHASAAAPAIVLAANGSATANVSSINNGPLAGMRNAIINGNFDIWQRGTSQTAAGYGSADRYASNRVGTTCTMSRQAFILGQTDVPGEPTYFCRMAVTSVAGAGNLSLLEQKIESVRTFAGQQVTVSFWAKADAAKPISAELVESFGSGGSPSSGVDALGVSKVTLSTSWQKITTTVTLPSISGKTLGSDNNDAIVLRIWFDAGSTYNALTDTLGQQSGTFDIAQVQVEPGPVATPFERRPIGTELALCQRYFQILNPANSICYVQGVDLARFFINYPEKRVTPTFSFTGTTSNVMVYRTSLSTTFNGTYGTENQNQSSAGISISMNTSVLTSGDATRLQVAPTISISAEL